jgi:hypothetical protein
MIHDVTTRLAEVLSAQPAPVLPSASIAPRRPGAAGDLPAVALSVTADRSDELGFGRLVRGSDQLPDGSRTRDDVRGDRLAGTVVFEVWASQAGGASQVAHALETKLGGERAALRERGFAWLRPVSLEPMERVSQDPSGASTFPAWRQRLAYRFMFESLEGGELEDGGLIRLVDVDFVEQPGEDFAAPTDT